METQEPVLQPWRASGPELALNATYLGRRLDTRAGGGRRALSRDVVQREGAGLAFLFPFGAVVCAELDEPTQAQLRVALAPKVDEPFERPEQDDLRVRRIDDGRAEGLDDAGVLWLQTLEEDRLRVVADVLAKTVVLDHFERTIGVLLDRMQPLVTRMQRRGRTGSRARHLVEQIGEALSLRQEMAWRVEVVEKPDFVWDRPDLERLWSRLSESYELGERHRALDRKAELLGDSASTLLGILHNERSLRVEWYIVLLIVAEIGLTLFEMWRGA